MSRPRKTYPDVKVGQVWRDRDPRMRSGSRFVRVESVAGVFAYYRTTGWPMGRLASSLYRSRVDRFQRAFELVED